MTGKENCSERPGFGEAPAFSVSAPADGDSPLAVLRFKLTAADMAAWLAGTRSERRALKALIASTFLTSMMGLQVISGRLPLPDAPWARGSEFLVLVCTPMILALWVRYRGLLARGKDLLPDATTVTVSQWPDRIEQCFDDKNITIRPRLLHRLTVTRKHILGETETARLILPRNAFADSAQMQLMADWLRSQGAS